MLFTRRSALAVLPPCLSGRRWSPWLRRRRTPTTSSCWLDGSKPTATSKGARAALERAAAADPKSAEVRAEIASLHLRRNERAEAEKAAKAALALDEKNVEANRVLGLIYAAAAEAQTSGRSSAQAAANVRDAITYLERAAAGIDGHRRRRSFTTRWAGSTSAPARRTKPCSR